MNIRLIILICLWIPLLAWGQKVVIVGGGPAGLATAIEASGTGNEVLVIEKRSSYTRKQTLFLTDTTHALLAKWEIADPGPWIRICTLEEALAARAQQLGVHFIEDEAIALKPGVVETPSRSLTYDVLVAADGAHSTLRSQLDIDIDHYGSAIGSIVITDTPANNPVETHEHNGTFIRKLDGGGRLSILFAQHPEGLSQAAFAHYMRLAGWETDADLLTSNKALAYIPSIPVTLQQATRFSDRTHRVLIVGDAAASASFFEGLGANTALLSATHAGACIQQECTAPALEEFEHAMRHTTDALIDANGYLFARPEETKTEKPLSIENFLSLLHKAELHHSLDACS